MQKLGNKLAEKSEQDQTYVQTTSQQVPPINVAQVNINSQEQSVKDLVPTIKALDKKEKESIESSDDSSSDSSDESDSDSSNSDGSGSDNDGSSDEESGSEYDDEEEFEEDEDDLEQDIADGEALGIDLLRFLKKTEFYFYRD